MRYKNVLFGSLTLVLSASAVGHGVMSEPASRNWTCGAIEKPDQAPAGSACAEAFEGDAQGGYQFMSVLTHDLGRAGVSPLPENVCGFDSETWDGGATPWDKPIDWPTNPMSAGEQTFTWDISWGPHFDDTEDFRYYITKPGFEYQVGVPLTWDDFESEPFCDLSGYDHSNPGATPDIDPEVDSALFHTTCNVPERSGRHVIYGEWGRNYFTYERFHGCIDVEFDGGSGPGPAPDVVASINANPSNSVFSGEGEISFSGANSQGSNLSFEWSLEGGDSSLYSLSSTSGETTVLSLGEPESETDLTVRLQVSDGESTSATSVDITHVPSTGTNWENLGSLTGESQTLAAGDEVQLRLVGNDGSDTYLPSDAMVVTSETAAADAWTYALAQEVNDASSDVRVGVLNDDGDVEPVQSATENRVYAQLPSDYASAFLIVDEQDGDTSSSAPSSSSSSSSSEPMPSGDQCNWYGTTYPLCENDSGWGWENNQSCIGAETCSSQPDPYGIVGGDTTPASSSSVAQSSAVGSSSSAPTNPGSGACEHVIENEWGSGFTGSIVVTNNGTSAINGWTVEWDYSGDTQVTNSWNAEVSGSGPYTATDMGWNGTIQPGESVEIGFQASGNAETPEVTGTVCD